jgi:uncharacterized protein YjdB
VKGLPIAVLPLVLLACADRDSTGVPPGPGVDRVTVAPASNAFSVGDTLTLVATVTRASGATPPLTVTWRSASPTAATVSATGTVTAIAAGSAVVRAIATADTRQRTSDIIAQ